MATVKEGIRCKGQAARWACLLGCGFIYREPVILHVVQHEVHVVEGVLRAVFARRHAGDISHRSVGAIEREEVVPAPLIGALVLEGCAVDVHRPVVLREHGVRVQHMDRICRKASSSELQNRATCCCPDQ